MLRGPAWLLIVLMAAPAGGGDRVTLALNWKAQPELGGFYQALADGTYARHGLEVTLREGGPLVNNRPLLAAGRVEFLVGTNLLQAFYADRQGLPTRVVAAFFQKDPQCLVTHPDGPHQTWDDLKTAPLLLGNPARFSFFLWMEKSHGFRRANLRPYNHALAPLLANPTWVQQGYATAEPKRIEEAAGRPGRVFLLADHGWNTYSTVLETRTDLIEGQPGLVQRFVDASILGWRAYLHGDNTAANKMIQSANPTLTGDQVAHSLDAMRAMGLVESGDAATRGIGAIDPARVREFATLCEGAGLLAAGEVDPDRAVVTTFVNRGVGLTPSPQPDASSSPGKEPRQ